MQIEPSLPQKLAAEFLGTGLLVLIGAGSVTATDFVAITSRTRISEADIGVIALAFGFIIAAVVYAIGKISGAHINPAVTVALLVTRRIDWLTAVGYIVAQLIGAFVGALCIAVIFGQGAATLGILGVTSYNPLITSPWQAVAAEGIGTFILVFTVFGVAVDTRAPAGWAGLIIGIVVASVIFVLGPVTGGSLNTARTFGPMLAQAFLGGKNLFDQFWVYIAGPIVGGTLGGLAYVFLIGTGPVAAEAGPVETNIPVTSEE